MRVSLVILVVSAAAGGQHMRVAVDEFGRTTPVEVPHFRALDKIPSHDDDSKSHHEEHSKSHHAETSKSHDDEEVSAPEPFASEPSAPDAEMYAKLESAVVRFMGIVRGVDPMNPWESTGRGKVFGGSGFIVDNDEEGPLMVTAAHAVADTSLIRVQAPGIDEKAMYKAGVVLINMDFDVALLRLHPDSWTAMQKTLKESGKTLTSLKMHDGPASIGMDTVVLGFPMKSKTVKVTSGALSGHESVGDFSVLQQTAPIGPGISGGPLLLAGTNEVLGINFATNAAANAQNINFAIPGWRVKQALKVYRVQSKLIGEEVEKEQHRQEKEEAAEAKEAAADDTEDEPTDAKEEKQHTKEETPGDKEQHTVKDGATKRKLTPSGKKHDHPDRPGKAQTQVTFELAICMMRPEMCEMRIPKTRVVSAPSDDDIRDYYGCDKGLFLSKVSAHSLLAHSEPPIDSKAFLMAVNDIELDNYGMGVDSKFIEDPVSFGDLLFMNEDLTKPVTVKTCSCGEVTEHKVNLEWRDQLRPGVYSVDQPSLTRSDFEMAAGLVIHPLTVNIAKFLVQAGRLDVLEYVTNPDGPPALVISGYSSMGMGMADDPTVSIGSIVKTVNGKKVSTLKEFREAFIPTKDDMKCDHSKKLYWTLTTDSGEQLVSEYKSMLEKALMMGGRLTPAMLRAVKAYAKAEQKKERAAKKPAKKDETETEDSGDIDESEIQIADDDAVMAPQSAVQENSGILEVSTIGGTVHLEGDSFGDISFDQSIPIEDRRDVRRGGMEFDLVEGAIAAARNN